MNLRLVKFDENYDFNVYIQKPNTKSGCNLTKINKLIDCFCLTANLSRPSMGIILGSARIRAERVPLCTSV